MASIGRREFCKIATIGAGVIVDTFFLGGCAQRLLTQADRTRNLEQREAVNAAFVAKLEEIMDMQELTTRDIIARATIMTEAAKRGWLTNKTLGDFIDQNGERHTVDTDGVGEVIMTNVHYGWGIDYERRSGQIQSETIAIGRHSLVVYGGVDTIGRMKAAADVFEHFADEFFGSTTALTVMHLNFSNRNHPPRLVEVGSSTGIFDQDADAIAQQLKKSKGVTLLGFTPSNSTLARVDVVFNINVVQEDNTVAGIPIEDGLRGTMANEAMNVAQRLIAGPQNILESGSSLADLISVFDPAKAPVFLGGTAYGRAASVIEQEMNLLAG